MTDPPQGAGAPGTADLFDLTGRRALVTGGAGFLGQRFAGALADLGAHVHLLDDDAGRLDAATAAIGRGALAIPVDVTDAAAVDRAVAGIAAGGAIDVLVNSAAIDPKFPAGAGANRGHLVGYPVEQWRRSLDVNLTGTFLVTQAVVAVMLGQGPRGRGAVVNVSSTYGLRGPDQRIYASDDAPDRFWKPVDYSTTKAGVLGFTRAVAAMLRGTEIRVNALTPGGAFHDQDEEFVAAYSARTILGRMAGPDEYRGAIAFLCSDASSYMTGANLVVDGGWTAS